MDERIERIIKRYGVRIVGDGTQLAVAPFIAKPQNAEDLDFLKAHKPEIISYIKAEKAKKEAEYQEYLRKLNGIEGLQEIRNALSDLESWHREFEKSFEDVGGMGVRQKPQYDFDALYAKYPRAAAYIRADNYSDASHYVKAAAGSKAKKRILDGDDPTTVIAEMETEWDTYCKNSID